MSYILNGNGIQVPTLQEHIDKLTTQFKSIYGENINVEQNTPDGQLINILAQNQTDIDEFIIQLYNSLNPSVSEGVFLDNIASLHGLKREAGSYTIVPVEITTSQPVQLQGLDSNYNIVESSSVFTVADNVGNQFYLINSVDLQQGITTVDFRAKNIGNVEVSLETITNIITPIVGVVSINNTSNIIEKGSEEETDLSLRNRFLNSFANGGSGSYQNIISSIYDINGVVDVAGENNNTNNVSSHGTAPHTIWLIVQGGSVEDIANAIFSTISAGCGMRGDVEYTIIDKQGQANTLHFDRPSYEDLYVEFEVVKKNASYVYDIDYIKQQLVNNLQFKLREVVDINEIASVLYNIDNNLIYKNIQISKDNMTWTDILENSNLNYIFTLSVDNITIMD